MHLSSLVKLCRSSKLFSDLKFSKVKCKVLHLDQSNSKHTYRLGRELIESSPVEKGLRVVVDKNSV